APDGETGPAGPGGVISGRAATPASEERAVPSLAGAERGPAPMPAALSAAAERLEGLLRTAPRDGSFRAAVGRVGALWRTEPLEQTAPRTHLDQVRRFDLPVVLEMFHPARRDTCFLALLSLDGDTALVAVGDARTLRVPVSALDRLWTRDATFLWRDFDAVGRGD